MAFQEVPTLALQKLTEDVENLEKSCRKSKPKTGLITSNSNGNHRTRVDTDSLPELAPTARFSTTWPILKSKPTDATHIELIRELMKHGKALTSSNLTINW